MPPAVTGGAKKKSKAAKKAGSKKASKKSGSKKAVKKSGSKKKSKKSKKSSKKKAKSAAHTVEQLKKQAKSLGVPVSGKTRAQLQSAIRYRTK